MAVGSVMSLWIVAILVHVPVHWFSHLGPFRPELGVFLFASILALVRTLLYVSCSWPHISVLGRILGGKPIRWGFDRVLVTPCLLPLVGLCGTVLLENMGLSIAWAVGITVFACISIAIAGPPTLRNWILTGHYRLTGALGARGYMQRF